MNISSHLEIRQSEGKGRGVFAKKKIKAHTIIETSPVLVIPVKQVEDLEKTLITNYVFEWGVSKTKRGLGMGYISMYNHSYDANCIYEMDYIENTISIITIKDIQTDEEVYINYNATPDDKKLVWFDKGKKK